MAERLLGALVHDIHDPRPIPEDSYLRWLIEFDWVDVHTQENSSIYGEWIKSKSIGVQVGVSLGANVDVGAGLSYSSSSTSRYDIGPARITTQTLNVPTYWLFRKYQDRLGKTPILSQPCYLVTGIKTAAFETSSSNMVGVHGTTQTLFAARYDKITIRNRWFSKKIITQEPYNKGATF